MLDAAFTLWELNPFVLALEVPKSISLCTPADKQNNLSGLVLLSHWLVFYTAFSYLFSDNTVYL